MPYLDRGWIVGDDAVDRDVWVPEQGWDRWQKRAHAVPDAQRAQMVWRQRSNEEAAKRLPAQRTIDDEPPHPSLFAVLAGDIAGAQRDGFLYTNLLERLKNDPSNATADDVIGQMQALGLASASWPTAVGGPPPHQSPRPFRAVLDWLVRLVGQVSEFLLECVRCAVIWLEPLGVTAVAWGISWPPSVSFEFSPEGVADASVDAFVKNLVFELQQRIG